MTGLCMASWVGMGQQTGKYNLPITNDKTTSLIFPFGIRYVDRGTKEVLVQQVSGADNVLLVKASTPNFKPTNLSVITADGKVYAFDVLYESHPLIEVHHVKESVAADSNDILFGDKVMNESDLISYAKGILDNPKHIGGIKDVHWGIDVRVEGIYLKDQVMFFQLKIKNVSAIDYDIDWIRFYIKDKRKSKRTASQEIILTPLYKTGNDRRVDGYTTNKLVLAFEKFTIPDAKFLYVQIGEKNGGRHLRLKMGNRKLVKAQILPEY